MARNDTKSKKSILTALTKLFEEHGSKYEVDITELAKAASISRPTVYKHLDYINSEIGKFRKGGAYTTHGSIINRLIFKLKLAEKNQSTFSDKFNILSSHQAIIFSHLINLDNSTLLNIRKDLNKFRGTKYSNNDFCLYCAKTISADVKKIK